MIKLMIKNKDEYSNYILESNDEIYEVNINFIGVDIPNVGDYIYIPKKVLNEKVSLNYGLIKDKEVNEEKIITLACNDKKIYLQRFYG